MSLLGAPEHVYFGRRIDYPVSLASVCLNAAGMRTMRPTSHGSRRPCAWREVAIGAAHEAEETLRNNLAVSLIIAMGVGVLVGYMIRRGSE